MQTTIAKTRLELVEGDIAEQDTDAVVTAAHWDLKGGQGTDGAIHFRAGRELLEECARIGGCPIGRAVITRDYNLEAPHVIHAVGPVFEEGDAYEADLLAGAYQSSLRVAAENDLKSVSFPSISTGAFCYPLRLTAPVALPAIIEFLEEERHELELVRLVLYTREDTTAYDVYAGALRQINRSGTRRTMMSGPRPGRAGKHPTGDVTSQSTSPTTSPFGVPQWRMWT